jgi:hypothetical protein
MDCPTTKGEIKMTIEKTVMKADSTRLIDKTTKTSDLRVRTGVKAGKVAMQDFHFVM